MNHKNPSPADPARSLALLWGSQTEAGRSGLTLKGIVAAAIDIADTDGVDALSMRNVAERLGVGTMSLYTHVPGKADLIDLMFDTAYGELYESVEGPLQQPGGWRGALQFIAKQNWDLYHRHPWMLQAATGRSVLGPHAAIKYEAELRPLDKLGLSDVEMDLDKLIDPARFPVATRVGTSAGQEYQSASSPEFAFTFGLERILAGIAELIAAKNSEENTHH